jgi:alpha(1,3/1,4) fucosyltransferase
VIKKIALIPSVDAYFNNQIFKKNFENDGTEPFSILKQELALKKIIFNTIDLFVDYKEIDLLIIMRHETNIDKIFNVLSKNNKVKILYISTEEISVAPTQTKELLDFGLFDRILTWRDNEIDSKLFFKYHYMTPHRSFKENIKSERKLVCLINAFKKSYYNDSNNIYSERFKVIEFYREKKTFDLFGHNWSNYDNSIQNYKGSTPDKIRTYSNYDFSFIFENSNNELGGISEKIWDSMSAGCIPIYYGAPNIADYIPTDCFIDYKKFNNLKSLDLFLMEMPFNEKTRMRKEIACFLNSKNYDKFTSIGFCKTIINNIEQISITEPITKSILKIKIKLFLKLILNKISFLKHKRLYYNLLISKYY